MAEDAGVPLEEFLKRLAGVSAAPQRSLASRAVSAVAEPLTGLLAKGLEVAGDTGLSPYSLAEPSRMIAETVIPQTPSQVLTSAGTVGAGLATGGAAPLAAATARIGGATLGAGAGALLEGQSPIDALQQAGTTGILTSLAEGVGFGLGKLFRGTATARRAIARTEQDEIVSQISDYVPGLDAAQNASQLKRLVKSRAPGSPKLQMDDRYLGAIKEVDQMIGRHPITVPTLGPAPMTIQDAVEQLKTLGQAGYGGAKDIPANRTFAGSAPRGDWKQAIVEIKAELMRLNPTGEASGLFEKARNAWAVGNAYLKILSEEEAIKGFPNYVEVDLNAVRRGYEKRYSKFERVFTPDDQATFERVLYRGGPFGSRDLIPGQPGMGAAMGQLLRQGGGTGTLGVLGPRTLLPNLGAQYTGRPPFTLPPGVQTGVDLGLQRLGGAGLGGPPLP